MKNFILIIASLLFITSCNKEDQDSQKLVSVRYVVHANHISPNSKIVRWKQLHSSNDFTDTVYSSNSERTIVETIYYAQCPEQLIFGARVVGETDTTVIIYTEIYIDGVLQATGIHASTYDYYQSEITTNVAWE